VAGCRVCARDARFLRSKRRPAYEAGDAPAVRIADLFAGGGGLSLGVAEAAKRAGLATEIALAVEEDDLAANIFETNFPGARLVREDVAAIFDGRLGARPTTAERSIAQDVGSVDILLAGPPCQGHSDLNNHTRRDDPRNALYLRVARAAQVLHPTFVVIENVPTVEHDKDGVVVEATSALSASGYRVSSAVLDLSRYGVPQLRRRHVLLASRLEAVDPDDVLSGVPPCAVHQPRTVSWAIRDLVHVRSMEGPDSPSRPTRENLRRMRWLIDNAAYDLPNRLRPRCHHGTHSYVSMYGRLRWDAPAQTITTGFGSMGQGRFVHPSLPRTITPHEAARLQTLPDFFELPAGSTRKGWAAVIANAVPPFFGLHVTAPLIRALGRDEAEQSTLRATGNSARSGAANGPPTTPPRGTSRRGVPPASSEIIRRRMSTTKRRDTGPELALRAQLHRMGLRYTIDRPVDGTRRRADIVFSGPRVAVYVDGCFWHGCPDHGTLPKKSREWWRAKLDANRRRDADTDARLREAGWVVLRFWEHDDPAVAAKLISTTVASRRHSRGPTSGSEVSRAVS
jgi:DNA (cytosine-5)-methyltransferase 1